MGGVNKKRAGIDNAASPAKVTKTLDFFFNKQKKLTKIDEADDDVQALSGSGQSDESIARRLQAQFDAELGQSLPNFTPLPEQKQQSVTDSSVNHVKQTTRLTSSHELVNFVNAIDFDVPPDKFQASNLSAQYADLTANRPSAPYALLARLFTQVDATKSRIKIVNSFTNYLRLLITIDRDSVLPSVWLSTNALSPPHVPLDLGIGGSVISKALKSVSGISAPAMKKLFDTYGDIGDVAFEAKVSVRTLVDPRILSIKDVYDTLIRIAKSKGERSQEMKQRYVQNILIRSRGEEVRYLTRTLVSHLRIGAVRTTMLTALSRAMSLDDDAAEAERTVRQCYARHPSYDDIVPALMQYGWQSLSETCPMTIHVPVMPMLGSITRDLSEMLAKVGDQTEFACEFKYDGQRAQVHCDERGVISIYSRHLELMTEKYPDIVAVMRDQVENAGLSSFILEGEIVAIDSTGSILSFQTLSNRARKADVIGSITIDVCLFSFDLMFVNGQSLLSRPFRERRELLRSLFTEVPFKFLFAKSVDAFSGDEDKITSFFESSITAKCEGIMVKLLDAITLSNTRKPLLATYEPDKRLESWLKVKKDYDRAADSLDLVPIGGWHGMGRKSNFWSPVLLAVRDPDSGTYTAVCKCISGFSDAFYKQVKDKYNENSINVTKIKPADINSPVTPEFFWLPQEVWEIKFADVTLSPVYTAARGMVDDRGLSVRFPRFVRKRDDKGVEEASTPQYLADIFRRQRTAESSQKVTAVDDNFENFY
ncbi:hypothetical protein V1514DRAFT_278079 [Lipomyces japonicus]|uniref:uncharacterized protein n=1 Tax=Lipomyces japonicus TaxID=56871 RepID=UPI0034CD2A55